MNIIVTRLSLLDFEKKLRAHIRARIERREFTGLTLSRQAGFQQAHLSNFLNSRRGLSLESMDRLLDALQIGVLDPLDGEEVQRHLIPPNERAGWQSVALISVEHVALPRFTTEQIVGTVGFRRSFLGRLRASDVCHRGDWLRFVSVELDRNAVRGVFPRCAIRANLLLDRHYTSLNPYRRRQPNLYAVVLNRRCTMAYVTKAGDHLVFRSPNPELPLELVRISRTGSYSQYIMGRVCHATIET